MMDELYTQICDALKNAKSKCQNLFTYTRKPQKSKGIKIKDWWDETLQELFERMKIAYLKYRNSSYSNEFKYEYLVAKKLVKARKKYNIKLKTDKALQKIDQLFKSDKKSFWKKIKKMQATDQCIEMDIDSILDGYKKIFTTENLSKAELTETKKKLDHLEKNSIKVEVKVCRSKLEELIKCLPNGKSIGITGISNEMLKYSQIDQTENQLVNSMVILFNKMFEYQMVPTNFNLSIIKPLIKDKKKPSNILNNLRAVTIADAIPNLFQKIVLDLIQTTHRVHHKQFGFKFNSSCSHAVFCLKQVAKYQHTLKKSVYCASLDLSMAFDKVNRDVLWIKLYKKGINPRMISVLRAYYRSSVTMVEKDHTFSQQTFKPTNGVQQGGSISPLLFSLYSEGFITEVEKVDEGIKIGNILLDCFMYADDIIIISGTKEGLQKQLNACEIHAKSLGLNFNPEKSMYLIFNSSFNKKKTLDKSQDKLIMGQSIIRQVKTIKYLGYLISDDNSEEAHIQNRITVKNQLIGKLTALGFTSKDYHPYLKAQMLKTYIRPIITYGLENTFLTKTNENRLKRQEGNVIKNCLQISRTCHTTDLYAALNIDKITNYIKRIKVKFFVRLNSNLITKELIKFFIELKDTNSFTTEIAKILEVNNQYNYESLLLDAKNFIMLDNKITKNIIKQNKSQNASDKIKEIKNACNSKDRNTISGKLFNLLKLDFIK